MSCMGTEGDSKQDCHKDEHRAVCCSQGDLIHGCHERNARTFAGLTIFQRRVVNLSSSREAITCRRDDMPPTVLAIASAVEAAL